MGDAFVTRLSADGSQLLFSAYLGGDGDEAAYALTHDAAGGFIVAGVTGSDDFPTTEEAFDRSFDGGDAFITRISDNGSELLYSTYLGGGSGERATALSPDGVGGIVVAGYTYSNDFPTSGGAFDRSLGACDAFIARLNSAGSDLLYSTYLGGGGDWEFAQAITPDGAGGFVVAGYTNSNNFPTTEGSYQSNYGGGAFDAFIARINNLEGVFFTNLIQEISENERSLIDLSVIGGCTNPDAQLTLSFSSPDLPQSATFEDYGNGSGTFTWQTTYGDAGNYTAHFVLSDGEHEISADVPIEVKELFHIELAQGWNLVSSPTPPADPDHRAVWRDLVERGNLEMVKDQAGFFYRPAINFKNLGAWDTQYGYLAKVSHADTLVVSGDPIASDSPISLDRTWSIVAYYPHESLTAPQAFAGIRDILDLVKDDHGRFYKPSINFSNMATLRRGKAYQVKVTEVGELVYPAGQRMQVEAKVEVEREPEHFHAVSMTGENMSVVVNVDRIMDNGKQGEIGVFTKAGLCVGSTLTSASASTSTFGLAVWGDDPTTPEVDGAREGEALDFRFWDGTTETVVLPKWTEGEAVYRTDGFAMGEVIGERAGTPVLPTEFALHQPFPNPFNSSTTVRFALAKPAQTRVAIFGLDGRLVEKLLSGRLEAGEHSVVWDASSFPSGLYIARLESGGEAAMQKLTLVK